jgi:transcriptional regulator EpsA
MNSNETLIRSRAELDILLVNIETAVQVRQRSDFFSWVQGVFQGLISHDVLICATAKATERSYGVECVSSIPVEEKTLLQLRPPESFIPRLIAKWERMGRQPLVVDERIAPCMHEASVRAVVGSLGLGTMLAHGVIDLEGRTSAFFCFTRLEGRLQEAHRHTLALITPYLYAAWIQASQRPEARNTVLPRLVLTARQIEILNWVEQGKSSNEIGQILNISHSTVKNHVQKILRKLNVQNRAQAVAKGISLQLTSW